MHFLNRNIEYFNRVCIDISKAFSTYSPVNLELVEKEYGYDVKEKATEKLFYGKDAREICSGELSSYLQRPSCLAVQINDPGHYLFLEEQMKASLVNKIGNIKAVCDKTKQIPVMLVIGVGLGYHISEIVKSFNIKHLIVIEPDSDMFYAAMCATNWEETAAKAKSCGTEIHFLQANNVNTTFQYLRAMMLQLGFHHFINMHVYTHSRYKLYANITNQFTKDIHHIIMSDGFFEDERLGLAHCTANVRTNTKILSSKDCKQKLPLIIVGNGPSLDNDIEFIKKNKHKAIICSGGSTLYTLFKAGIVPHIHFEMERGHQILDIVSNVPISFTKRISFVGLCTTYPEVFKRFRDAYMVSKDSDINIPFLRGLSQEELCIPRHMNPTVSNFIFSFAVNVGFKEIYLAGVDLGSVDKNKHHSSLSSYSDNKLTYDDDMFIEAEGNFQDKVHTSVIFKKSCASFHSLILERNDEKLNVYNLSDGIKIGGTIAKRSSEVVIKNKVTAKQCLDKLFNKRFINLHEPIAYNQTVTRELLPGRNLLLESKLPEVCPDDIFKFLDDKYRKCMELNYHNHRMISGTMQHLCLIIFTAIYSDKNHYSQVREHVNKFIDACIDMFDNNLFSLNLLPKPIFE